MTAVLCAADTACEDDAVDEESLDDDAPPRPPPEVVVPLAASLPVDVTGPVLAGPVLWAVVDGPLVLGPLVDGPEVEGPLLEEPELETLVGPSITPEVLDEHAPTMLAPRMAAAATPLRSELLATNVCLSMAGERCAGDPALPTNGA